MNVGNPQKLKLQVDNRNAVFAARQLPPSPLAGLSGSAFLGFPLHPAGKPSDARAKHLSDVHVPMLFVQGTRDKLAELQLLEPFVKRLGTSASLHLVQEADHSFHVLARSGRNDRDVMSEIAGTLSGWIGAVAG